MTPRVLSAFLFIVGRGLANRLAAWVRKLRRPRYAVGAALVLLYFGWIFWHPIRTAIASRSQAGDGGMHPAQAIAIALGFLQVLLAWVLAAFGHAIVFTETEVQLLFPAPLRRRDLLVYRWLKEQPGSAFGALVLALMLKAAGAPAFGWTFLGCWLTNNVLAAHGTVARLVGLGLRRGGPFLRALAPLPAVAIAAAAVWAILDVLERDPAARTPQELRRLLLESDAFRTVFRPLIALTSMVSARSFLDFARPAAYALVALAVLRALVHRLDVAFEERSLELATRLGRLKSEGWAAAGGTKSLVVKEGSRPIFRLEAEGAPWVAFVWKNLISIGRFRKAALLVVPIIVVSVIAVVGNTSRGRTVDARVVTGMILFGVALYSALIGPSLLRIDLRLDLAHFDVLKAMPVRGRQLILGEVLATTLTLWVFQLVALAIGLALTTRLQSIEFDWRHQSAILVGGGLFLGGLDFAVTTTQNVIALYFPSFVRVGRGMHTDIEAYGQQMIGGLLQMFGYILLLILPGIAAWLFGWIGWLAAGLPGAIGAAGCGAGAVLVAQSFGLIALSESRFERYDLTAEHLTSE